MFYSTLLCRVMAKKKQASKNSQIFHLFWIFLKNVGYYWRNKSAFTQRVYETRLYSNYKLNVLKYVLTTISPIV